MKKWIHSGQENENPSSPRHEHVKSSRQKYFSQRGLRFLVGGLIGGTMLVAVMSFVFDDWSHLTRWLGGLAVLGIMAVYLGKKWLLGRAMHLTRQNVEAVPRAREPDAQVGSAIRKEEIAEPVVHDQ